MKNNNLTSFSDHLDLQYGKPGTESRKKYEEEFEVFKNGVAYTFELHQSLRKFHVSQVVPCSALFNNTLVGGFLFTCSSDDLKFFNITFATLPQPDLKFRMLNSDYKSYLIEIHLLFDNDKTLKFHLNPVHPEVKMVFNLLKKEQKIAFHFYNKKTDKMAVTYTKLDEDKMNWITRNDKLINNLQINNEYQELVKYMTKNMVNNDKLFKFDDSKRIEQTFILKNSKVVKLL
jgi:hypothetical protein